MSICLACGDVELVFVPECGDPAIGSANVLLFAKDELREFDAEERLCLNGFSDIEQARTNGTPDDVIEKQEHLAKMLEGYIKPNATLPSKHMVQVYRVSAKRWTFVRSDKMRNHWRSYRMDRKLLDPAIAGGARPAPGGSNAPQLDRSKLRQAFADVGSKVADDLRGGISFKGNLIKDSVSGSITDVWDANWLQWVDDVNESLQVSGSSSYHDLSAGAQLLRGYAGYGGQVGYDTKTGKYGISGHANAKVALAEASGKFNGYLPHRDGWHAVMNYVTGSPSQAGQQQNLDFGYFRFNIEMKADAMLGASIIGTAELSFTPLPNGQVSGAGSSTATGKGEIAAGAFAGIEVGATVMGSLEWDNPENQSGGAGTGFKPMVSIGASVAVNLGAGLSGELHISLEGGRLMFRCKAQAVLGVGAKGGMIGVVGFDTMLDFIMYVYHQLKDNNFSYLQFMDESAFHFVTGAVLLIIEKGIDGVLAIGSVAQAAVNAIQSDLAGANEAEEFAKKIKSKPSVLFFASPEAKGAILYRLSERYTFSFEEHQEAAILTVVSTMQTQREWEQVVERITRTGQKSSRAAGEARLNAVLDGGSQTKYNAIVRAINSLPARTMLAGVAVNRSQSAMQGLITAYA